MVGILSLVTGLALGATFAHAVTYTIADKGGYTLFDTAISTEAPPSSLFPSTAGLATWLPPRFLAPGIVGSMAIPTNNWWGNLIASSSDTTANAAASVWTNPYVVRPLLVSAPYGLSVNYPYPNRFSDGSTGHGSLYYASAIATDFVLSAAEFTAAPALQVTSWDDLSVSLRISQSPLSTSTIAATLVPGMGLITATYTSLTPRIIAAASNVLLINNIPVMAGSFVVGTRFVVVLDNGQKWVLYASAIITLTLSGTQTLTTSNPFTGYIRLALVVSGAQLAALDNSASCLLEGSNIEAKDASAYLFHLKTSGDCTNGLFHYLQVHHMDTLDPVSATAVSGATAFSATRGPMTGVLTITTPPVLRFIETQNVPVRFYPSRSPRADLVASQNIKEALIADLNATWSVPLDGSYYFNGKAVHKFANLCLVASDDIVSGSDKAVLTRQCLDKLETVLAPLLDNSWTYQLQYDTTYRGIISPLGLIQHDLNADFGNSMYNDHHYHYGYWIAASAIVNLLDPAWSGLHALNRMTRFLVRDVANPSRSDTAFPKFRQFDWFRGHSYSHGITSVVDGKDQESASEDINFHYAVALFGKATNDSVLATVGELMLKLNTRAVQNYFLLTDDNRVHPPTIITNKVTGILWDNKVQYMTWFSTQAYAIHGIQMLPITSVTEFVRTPTFVTQEWDAILSKIPDIVANKLDNPWLSLLYANYAIVNMTAALEKLHVVSLDDGLSRSWALYMAASSASKITPPVPTTPTPTTPTPTTPTPTTPTPTTTVPATPVPTTPTPTTPLPTTPTPTPTPTTSVPTTPTPTTPVPTTRTPTPTTPQPTIITPTAAPNGVCGNDKDGPTACPTGQYCQPWNPSFYQCRSIGSTLCGTQRTGVDFFGDDLATVQVNLPEQCCDKCRATSNCAAYTFVNYNADGKAYCYLKKGTGTAKPVVGVVSAAIVITTPTPTPTPTTPTPTPTPTTTPTCSTPPGGQCGSDATGISCCPSAQYCQPWNPSFYQCLPKPSQCPTPETSIDFYGSDLQTIQGILPSECCSTCASTPKCVAYTFVNYNANGKSACYLKSGVGTRKTAVGVVSAVVLSPMSTCSYSTNVDFYGNDLAVVTGLTVATQCCDKCASTAGCAAFTFVHSVCYLKKSAAGKTTLNGAMAGVVN